MPSHWEQQGLLWFNPETMLAGDECFVACDLDHDIVKSGINFIENWQTILRHPAINYDIDKKKRICRMATHITRHAGNYHNYGGYGLEMGTFDWFRLQDVVDKVNERFVKKSEPEQNRVTKGLLLFLHYNGSFSPHAVMNNNNQRFELLLIMSRTRSTARRGVAPGKFTRGAMLIRCTHGYSDYLGLDMNDIQFRLPQAVGDDIPGLFHAAEFRSLAPIMQSDLHRSLRIGSMHSLWPHFDIRVMYMQRWTSKFEVI